MRKFMLTLVSLITTNVFAQVDFAAIEASNIDSIESQIFGDATFSGSVDFVNSQRLKNGRFCSQARKIKFPNNLPLTVEGPRLGDSKLFARGTVNGRPGRGFLNVKFENLPTGFNLVSTPADTDPTPRGRQQAACGLFSLDSNLLKANEQVANVEHTLFVGCRERNRGRRVGNFYLCFQRNYVGQLTRTPR